MTYSFIDAHVHLLGKKIIPELEIHREHWLEAGVKRIVNMTSSLNESKQSFELLTKYPEILIGVGKHPWKVKHFNEKEKSEFENLISSNICNVIGEVGLDYYSIKSEKRYVFQRKWFEFFIELSNNYKKPLNVHVTGAESDIEIILNKNWDRLTNVNIHWYSGNKETFEKLVDLGCYFSINPAVYYSQHHQDIVANVPDDKLLTESDGDVFYKPIDQLGKPGIIPLVVEKICLLKNLEKSELIHNILLNFENYLQK